jgi:hypothetical protein
MRGLSGSVSEVSVPGLVLFFWACGEATHGVTRKTSHCMAVSKRERGRAGVSPVPSRTLRKGLKTSHQAPPPTSPAPTGPASHQDPPPARPHLPLRPAPLGSFPTRPRLPVSPAHRPRLPPGPTSHYAPPYDTKYNRMCSCVSVHA